MAKKPKYHVVWKGRQTGIFTSWEECSAQVSGYPDAQYKTFYSREAAEQALRGEYEDYKGKHISSLSQERLLEIGAHIPPPMRWICSSSSGVRSGRCHPGGPVLAGWR